MGCDVTDIQKTENKDTEDKRLSFLELLIQERNLKRRRAKHRGVHTNKKSRTEILREIIDRQMQFYTDYVSETRATNSGRRNANAAACEIASPDMKLEGSPRYQESSSSREKSDGSCGRSRDSRIVTESTRPRKLRKRKRSRSRDHDRGRGRDHDRDRRDKRGHTRTRYRRSDSKRCETDRSVDWQENL